MYYAGTFKGIKNLIFQKFVFKRQSDDIFKIRFVDNPILFIASNTVEYRSFLGVNNHGIFDQIAIASYPKHLPPLRLHQMFCTRFPRFSATPQRITQFIWEFTQIFGDFLHFIRKINPWNYVHNNGDALVEILLSCHRSSQYYRIIYLRVFFLFFLWCVLLLLRLLRSTFVTYHRIDSCALVWTVQPYECSIRTVLLCSFAMANVRKRRVSLFTDIPCIVLARMLWFYHAVRTWRFSLSVAFAGLANRLNDYNFFGKQLNSSSNLRYPILRRDFQFEWEHIEFMCVCARAKQEFTHLYLYKLKCRT